MKLSNKLSLSLCLTGTIVLIIFLFVQYEISNKTVIEEHSKHAKLIAEEVARDIDYFLQGKVNVGITLANIPTIQKALEISNFSYSNLSDEKQQEIIKLKNNKWKSIKDPNNKFILEYTDNNVSRLLKNQQDILKGKYGEIFLTNKFGALVASTAKLSTFAHGHKYWWLGAYDNGKGAIFFDDRGYDDSVGGYVLGLVVPVKKDGQIVGILKCNLNIIGTLSKVLSNKEQKSLRCLKLVRSGGMIVYDEGVEPLSARVPDIVTQKFKNNNIEPFFINTAGETRLVALAQIDISKEGTQGYAFGGTFESIDHKKGNKGESWYILCSRSKNVIDRSVRDMMQLLVLAGVIIIIALAFVSFLLGKMITRPLLSLKKATKEIGKGDFRYRITEKWNDEFGNLAESFNKMAEKLLNSTISVLQLEKEVIERERVEKVLKKSQTFLESSLESSGNMIILSLDKNYQYYFFNNTHAESMNHVFGTKPEIGDCIFDLMQGDDDIKKVKEHYDRALAGESHIVIEEYGEGNLRFYYEIQYNPMYNSENEIIGVTSFAQNITKRIESENKIKQFSRIFEESLNEIYLFDADTLKFNMVNKSAQNNLGYNLDELQNLTPFDIKPEFTPESFAQLIEPLRKGEKGKIVFETIHKRKDQSVYNVEVHLQLMTYEHKSLFSAIIIDITDRKQIQEKHIESEKRFRTIYENAPVLIDAFDKNGRCILWNKQCQKTFGWTIDEINTHDNTLALFYPDPVVRDEVMQTITTHPDGDFRKWHPITKDGKTLTTMWANFSFSDGIVFSLGHDITERTKMEKKLQSNTYTLGERVKELDCLYEISKLTDEAEMSLDKTYQKTVDLIPPAMQYPKNICSRILIGEQEYKTENFKKTKWILNKDIIAHGECIGSLEIYHLKEKLDVDNGFFLKAERDLLNAISNRLGRIIERLQGQVKIKASLREKEILLSEIHHRVKNNMQVIISLLRLQAGKAKNIEQVKMLKESENRVLSMAIVHEMLYQSEDFLNIDFHEYINNLLSDLFISYGVNVNKIKLDINCIDIFLDIENAIPCGLIINELVTNTLKYAFSDTGKGKIEVSVFSVNKDEVELIVSDDGVGIPKDIDVYNTDSMGLSLVKVLSEETLEGKMELDRGKGTKFYFKLKKVKYKPRI